MGELGRLLGQRSLSWKLVSWTFDGHQMPPRASDFWVPVLWTGRMKSPDGPG